MKRRLVHVAAAGLVAAIAACAGSSATPEAPPTTTAATTAAPTTTVAPATTTTAAQNQPAPASTAAEAVIHAVAADPLVVTGTAACDFSDDGVAPEGGAGFRVTCELDLSDPRVRGTEIHDRFRFIFGGDTGDVWGAEEAVITNDEGTWRGSAQAADDGTPIGEARYIGEGAYAGLEFHYYFSHVDLADKAHVRGWISERS